MLFIDRIDAGRQLAEKLTIENPKNTIALALPRGGVPLALEIAKTHQLIFDVVLAKKIVHPSYSEFAIGALAENGEPILNEETKVDKHWIQSDTLRVRKELTRRRTLYNQFLNQQSLFEKDLILIDDGIATGMTMFAAIEAIKFHHPHSITVAVPIIPNDTFHMLNQLVDRVVYIEVPTEFRGAVGAYYQRFPQISDEEVQEMIETFNQL